MSDSTTETAPQPTAGGDADKYRLWQAEQMFAAAPDWVPVIRGAKLCFAPRAAASEAELALEPATRKAHGLPPARKEGAA